MPSTERNASGIESLRLAESSSERSSHWVACVSCGSCASAIVCRAMAQIRSDRIGFLLYGMADDPICSASNGSSTSLRCANSLTSCAILDADDATPASVARIWASILRLYVWPVTPKRSLKPMCSATEASRRSTLS